LWFKYYSSADTGCYDNNAVANYIDNQFSSHDNDSFTNHKSTNYSTYYYER